MRVVRLTRLNYPMLPMMLRMAIPICRALLGDGSIRLGD